MRTIQVTFALLLAATAPALAQASHPDLLAGPGAVKWGPAPPSLPKGAMLAVLSGDPSKSGPYVLRLKMPSNYQIPAHHHPTTENVTVISGSFRAGMGDRLDRGKTLTFAPGGFAAMPAGMNHYGWVKGETVVQVHGDGPFEVVYVNSADDPTKK